MIETLTALLLAHAVADFLLQTDWMIRTKRRPTTLAVHIGIVLITAMICVGHWNALPVLALAGLHLVIDCIKTYGGFRSFLAFALDQIAHVATVIGVAIYAPDLWQTGHWAGHSWILPILGFAAGLIFALSAGQHAVGLLMRPHASRLRQRGLRNGGRQIGMLERGLIFLFVFSGQPLGVGFLIAAKSILRFGTASRDQTTAEYVIIGTLASVGWAFLAAEATLALIDQLPPLALPFQ